MRVILLRSTLDQDFKSKKRMLVRAAAFTITRLNLKGAHQRRIHEYEGKNSNHSLFIVSEGGISHFESRLSRLFRNLTHANFIGPKSAFPEDRAQVFLFSARADWASCSIVSFVRPSVRPFIWPEDQMVSD